MILSVLPCYLLTSFYVSLTFWMVDVIIVKFFFWCYYHKLKSLELRLVTQYYCLHTIKVCFLDSISNTVFSSSVIVRRALHNNLYSICFVNPVICLNFLPYHGALAKLSFHLISNLSKIILESFAFVNFIDSFFP